MIGFHSTIDRPDSVSRVAPPTIRVRKIIAAAASSQQPHRHAVGFRTLWPARVIVVCLQGLARTI